MEIVFVSVSVTSCATKGDIPHWSVEKQQHKQLCELFNNNNKKKKKQQKWKVINMYLFLFLLLVVLQKVTFPTDPWKNNNKQLRELFNNNNKKHQKWNVMKIVFVSVSVASCVTKGDIRSWSWEKQQHKQLRELFNTTHLKRVAFSSHSDVLHIRVWVCVETETVIKTTNVNSHLSSISPFFVAFKCTDFSFVFLVSFVFYAVYRFLFFIHFIFGVRRELQG